jgi:hypothetical protein
MKQTLRGWNSFDSYGIFITENQVLENLSIMQKQLLPYGYDIFCIDLGWYADYEFQTNPNAPIDVDKCNIYIDEYGRFIPSPVIFPHGFEYIANLIHEAGMKFGVHIMRGIPRAAYEKNSPILNTDYTCRDIADKRNICIWGPLTYGIDTDHQAAQAYYDSEIALLASWGVDFIKADDIISYPEDVKMLHNAIKKCGRNITLSLSPGNQTSLLEKELWNECADSIRISSDIWDREADIDKIFTMWELWEDFDSDRCNIDLDMIPFGKLQVYAPPNLEKNALFAGEGKCRDSQLTLPQKRTFITQRALAASPLFMGGELNNTSKEEFNLLTNADMLACQANQQTGKKIFHRRNLDVRYAPRQDGSGGWLGIFNRNCIDLIFHDELKEIPANCMIKNIWNNSPVCWKNNKIMIDVPAHDVVFIYCEF